MTIIELFVSSDPYCKPNSGLIEENKAGLVVRYNPTTPIAKLFWRFEECRDIATANNNAFTENQLLQKFIALMEKTKVYDNAVEEWNSKPTRLGSVWIAILHKYVILFSV